MKNKLNINIITPFPEMIEVFVDQSILSKAKQKGIVNYNIINLFNFLSDDRQRIDDYPFGGGAGMILKPEPIFAAIKSIKDKNMKKNKIIFPTPDGKLFNQKIAFNLSKEESITFICGHYKGVDQRIREELVTDEYSIGDFVLTNGEIPSIMMVDSIVRLKEGVLNNYDSALKDSFSDDLLDGPHYTRPRVFENHEVPNVLLSGNHKEIEEWFLKKREEKTKKRRKDLWKKYMLKNRNGAKDE